MADETVINPLGNFDPFAKSDSDTTGNILDEATIALSNVADVASKASRLGWKAYSIAGVSAIALTGGAVAGFNAFASTPNTAAKAAPKLNAEEEPQPTDQAPDQENEEHTFDQENAELQDETNPSGVTENKDQQAQAPTVAAANADQAAGSSAAAAPAPEFDHNQFSSTLVEFSDQTSFSEAFASARTLCGPGGTFIWHGHAYSTYYREEWDSMTPGEQNNYLANADRNFVDHMNDDQRIEPDQFADGPIEAVDDESLDALDDELYAYQAPDTPGADADGGDIDMTLGEVRTYQLEDGEVTVGEATIDGHQAVFMDVDNDGTFDVLAIDANDNGDVDDNEMTNISAQNITVTDFQNAAQDYNPENYNSDLADFTNDADVSDFA